MEYQGDELAAHMVDGWCVRVLVDDDGHLNVYLSNGDGTQVHDVGEDLSCDDEGNHEWGARFTTDGIEENHNK